MPRLTEESREGTSSDILKLGPFGWLLCHRVVFVYADAMADGLYVLVMEAYAIDMGWTRLAEVLTAPGQCHGWQELHSVYTIRARRGLWHLGGTHGLG